MTRSTPKNPRSSEYSLVTENFQGKIPYDHSISHVPLFISKNYNSQNSRKCTRSLGRWGLQFAFGAYTLAREWWSQWMEES